MEIRKTILSRFSLFYVAAIIFALLLMGNIFIIQQDKSWDQKSQRLDVKEVTIPARRGDICADDGRPLATSVPYYELRMDLAAPGVKEVFNAKVDSLAYCLAHFFKDKSEAAYRHELRSAYRQGARYHLINPRKVNYLELQKIEKFPIFRRGRNRGGLIAEQENLRVYPFGNMATRTLGRMSSTVYGGTHGSVGYYGLEEAYESYLKGEDGLALKRNLSGRWLYVSKEDPQDGYNLITTINVNFQDMVMHALKKEMVKSQAKYGTAVLMDVKTGDIKAIANYGRDDNGDLVEGYQNYAIGNSGNAEPGSTFKLVSLMAALEDGKVDTSTIVDTGNGVWKYKDRTVYDSDWRHGGHGKITMKQVFELSSNVGVAKIITKAYAGHERDFVDRIYSFGLNQPVDLGIKGEAKPFIKYPGGGNGWSGVTLAWMSFGYELKLTPLQMLTFYNAVANNGRMVEPRLVQAIERNGREVKEFKTKVMNPKICSSETLKKVHDMLRGVVVRGTAKSLNTPAYEIAGKTGTAQVANQSEGYFHASGRIYQASFVGYFPADKPRYSCIVVINGPKGAYYGGSVAGPVFREISDNVYASDLRMHDDLDISAFAGKQDYPGEVSGKRKDLEEVLDDADLLNGWFHGSSEWAEMDTTNNDVELNPLQVVPGVMPKVTGMGASDAVYILENRGLRVSISGRGKVLTQSIPAGTKYQTGQSVRLRLGE